MTHGGPSCRLEVGRGAAARWPTLHVTVVRTAWKCDATGTHAHSFKGMRPTSLEADAVAQAAGVNQLAWPRPSAVSARSSAT